MIDVKKESLITRKLIFDALITKGLTEVTREVFHTLSYIGQQLRDEHDGGLSNFKEIAEEASEDIINSIITRGTNGLEFVISKWISTIINEYYKQNPLPGERNAEVQK